MDGFTNINIFDTKGIEYIVVILFLAILIPFWIILNRKTRVTEQIRESVRALTAEIFQVPQGIFFNPNHTWAYLEKTGLARVGIDDFILKIAGSLNVKPLKIAGDPVCKGDIIAEAFRDRKSLKIFSPLTGHIAGVNQLAGQGDEILENGWLYDIKPQNWKAETVNSYLAEDATAWLKNELLRFKDFLSESTGKHSPEKALVFQEGGELRIHPLVDLQSEIWDEFQKEFLNTTS